MSSSLPVRAGERPRTTPSNPHTQLDQQPTDVAWTEELARRVFALLGVVEEPSRIAPRDEADLDVIEGLVRASHAFARAA